MRLVWLTILLAAFTIGPLTARISAASALMHDGTCCLTEEGDALHSDGVCVHVTVCCAAAEASPLHDTYLPGAGALSTCLREAIFGSSISPCAEPPPPRA